LPIGLFIERDVFQKNILGLGFSRVYLGINLERRRKKGKMKKKKIWGKTKPHFWQKIPIFTKT